MPSLTTVECHVTKYNMWVFPEHLSLCGAALLSNLMQVDRELARFIYVREVKRFDPFKFSIYAWCIKIAIAGSLAPVRLAWVPFLGVPKNGFIYVEADTKKLYAGLQLDVMGSQIHQCQ